MGALSAGLSMILAKIAAAIGWVGDLYKSVFVAVVDVGRDLGAWVFDQLLTVSKAALGAMDFSAMAGYAASWAGLPAQVKEVIAAIGLGTAFGIIVSAIGIRIALQLIPFTRLGS